MPSWIARFRSATLVPTSKPATRYFSRFRLRYDYAVSSEMPRL